MFLSHSSKTRPHRSLTARIEEALERAGFAPFCDRTGIRGGEAWPEVLHVQLASCSAGIVLFSEEALTSNWVLKEATVLSWRRALDPRFVLIPVLLSGVTRAALRSGPLAPLELHRLNCLEATTRSLPGRLAARLTEEAHLRPEDTPLERFTQRIADVLGDRGEVSSRIAARLNLRVSPGQIPSAQAAAALAHELVQRSLELLVEVLQEIGPALGADRAERLRRLAMPLWLPIESAARLAEVSTQIERPALGLTGDPLPWLWQTAGDRAYWGPGQWHPVQIAAVGSIDLVEDIVAQIRAEFHCDSDEVLDACLRHSKLPHVVLVPTLIDVEAMHELRDRVPRVTFVYGVPLAIRPALNVPSNGFELLPRIDEELLRRARVNDLDAQKVIAGWGKPT